MSSQSMTVAQIEAQISDRRECLALLDQEAKDLALSVVSGDQDATAALASISAEVRQIAADLAVLENARLMAAQQQQTASDAEIAAHRARHREIARDHAAVLVKLAARVDDLAADFRTVFAEMSATERAIWTALREASATPSDVVVGRKNLGSFAIDALTAFTKATDRFRRTRAVADVAKAAWADLLVSERSDDV